MGWVGLEISQHLVAIELEIRDRSSCGLVMSGKKANYRVRVHQWNWELFFS